MLDKAKLGVEDKAMRPDGKGDEALLSCPECKGVVIDDEGKAEDCPECGRSLVKVARDERGNLWRRH